MLLDHAPGPGLDGKQNTRKRISPEAASFGATLLGSRKEAIMTLQFGILCFPGVQQLDLTG
ncbi:MAG TPA: hypothetical protein PLX84_14750, partial [Acidiphilium sp.]|nr:hypothetical protein [Acidiphilium sp.]